MKGILNKALSLALLMSAFPAIAMNDDVVIVSAVEAALASKVAASAVAEQAGQVAAQAVAAPVSNVVSASSNFVVAQAQQGRFARWVLNPVTKLWEVVKAHPKTTAGAVTLAVAGTGAYMLYNRLGNKANKPADAKQVEVSATEVTTLDAMLQAVNANDIASLEQGSTRLTSDVVKNMQFGNPEKGGELYSAYTFLNTAIKNLKFIGVFMGKDAQATAETFKAQQAYLTNYIDAMRGMVILNMPAQPLKVEAPKAEAVKAVVAPKAPVAPVVPTAQEVVAANKPATPAQVSVEARPVSSTDRFNDADEMVAMGLEVGRDSKLELPLTKSNIVTRNLRTIGLATAGTAGVGLVSYAAKRYLGK